MDKLFAFFVGALLVFIGVVLVAGLFAIVTQWAWSGTLVELFHFPELSLFQAWKLNILGGLLCKGSSSSK
jgi:hypothetical protein